MELAKNENEFESRTKHDENIIKTHWSQYVNKTAKDMGKGVFHSSKGRK